MPKIISFLLFFTTLSLILMSYGKKPAPTGYTGSPSDGQTCGTGDGCHGGGTTLDNNMIDSDIPSTGFEYGQTYSISVTVSFSGRSKFGFSCSPQDDNGNLIGTLIAGSGTSLSTSGKYMSHLASTTSGMNDKTWSFQWTAPSSGTEVTFYAAGNAANGNEEKTGDIIYNSVKTYLHSSQVVLGIENISNTEISIYPNPVESNLTIENINEIIELFDLNGNLVLSKNITDEIEQINFSELKAGIYLLKAGEKSQKIIKL